MARFSVDPSVFDAAAQALSGITSELDGLPLDDDALAGSVGHPGLTGRVDASNNAWHVERYAVLSELREVAAAFRSAASAVADADQNAAAQIAEILAPGGSPRAGGAGGPV